jgi:hypothetical protein
MTNIAHLVLALTLAQNAAPGEAPSAEPSATGAPASQPEASSGTPAAAVPAATPTSTAAPAPAVAKPPEDNIETLSEVVDLEDKATQDPAAAYYGKGFPERIRILALPTARAVRKRGFDFVIDHRSSKAIYDRSGKQPGADLWNNLLGFDGSMAVGLGLRYGILDRLDAGLYRIGGSGTYQVDTYEFDVRYQALSQETQGIDVGVRGGATWFVQRNAKDSSGFFGQLHATRLLANRFLLTAGALFHSNSTNASKFNEDKKYSLAWAAGAEVRLAAAVSVDAEIVSCTFGYCSKNPAFSAGLKFLTVRHTFALVCGNTQFITADGYLTNTERAWKDVVIGFNITREN